MPERWTKATVYPDMWVDPAEDPREALRTPVGELATHRTYLRQYRMTLVMKCDGLDADQMAHRSVPPSTLSLLGLVRHLAYVERTWFRREPGVVWLDAARGPEANADEVVRLWRARSRLY